MNYYSILLSFIVLIFIPSQSLIAQSLIFNFGESYASVISELKKDKSKRSKDGIPVAIDILELEDRIIRISKPWEKGWGGGMNVYEYHFTDNKLSKKVIIMSPGNADNMLAFSYKIQMKDLGEPNIIQTDGNRIYCWDRSDKTKSCYYKEFSDWFQDECFFVVHEPSH